MNEGDPAMFASIRKHNRKISLVGDMVFSLLTMSSAISLLKKWLEIIVDATSEKTVDTLVPTLFMMYTSMGLARLFRAFRYQDKSGTMFVYYLVYCVAMIVCGGVVAAVGYSTGVIIAVAITYWVVLLAGRVLAIVRNHQWWSVLLNVLLILLFAICAALAFEPQTFFIVIIMAAFLAFLSITQVIFSRMRLDILKDIIQQTYTLEIILGLVLLMFTFSYALEFLDDAFVTFEDGLWYCFAVVTTIGFGDITATSLPGRIMTAILGVYGIVVVALLTSVIVNFYGEMKRAGAKEKALKGEPPEKTEP